MHAASELCERPVANIRETDIFEEAIYYRLFIEAEAVRWRMADISWERIDTSIDLGWVALARELAYTELTPFSATAQYLQNYASNIDFTQWITVWLYEEMKHPQALIRWLHAFDVRVDHEFIQEGRFVTTIPSLMATLVTNIYAEIQAWSTYMHVSRRCPDEVLSTITRNLAGDEARHAGGFFAYAKKLLEKSPNPDTERMAALRTMYFWAETSHLVEHPVNLFYRRMKERPEVLRVMSYEELAGCARSMYSRVYPMLSGLLGLEIKNVDDIKSHMLRLRSREVEGS